MALGRREQASIRTGLGVCAAAVVCRVVVSSLYVVRSYKYLAPASVGLTRNRAKDQ